MSSGQSLRNGSSVEPGLPNTRLMPNARSRLKVASLTVVVALAALAGLRDDIGRLPLLVSWRSVIRDEAIHLSMDWFAKSSSANLGGRMPGRDGIQAAMQRCAPAPSGCRAALPHVSSPSALFSLLR